MTANPAFAPVLFTGLLGWIYYRRIASSFGRQPWRPVRAGVRLALLSVALFFLVVAGFFLPGAGLAIGLGALAGAVLGGFALRYTHAEVVDGQQFFTPNRYIGGALSLLLIGRMLWRLKSAGGIAAIGASGAGYGQGASPLTLAIAATLVCFYVVNTVGLFVQMRRLAATAPAPEKISQS